MPRARLACAMALTVAVVLLAPQVRPDPATGATAGSLPSGAAAPSPAAAVVPELEASVRAVALAFKEASVGIAVLDVDSGRVLAAVNEHTALNPASNAKLYTAGAALAMLRGTHRYETTLTGKLNGDTVSELTLKGYGDPSLTTSDLWSMVQELKEYGVKRVQGDIRVDQRFYDEQTTPPAFEQQPNEWAAFRAPVSAVALNENCITMTVRPSSPGGLAHVDFEPPGFVDVDGNVRTAESGGADSVVLELSPEGSRLAAKVGGAVSADSRVVRYTRRAEDPRLLPGYALQALLQEAHVSTGGEIKLGGPETGHVLAKHSSEPLSALLYALGKQSDNFYAEMIFKSLAGEVRVRPAKSMTSAELVMHWLEKIGAADEGVVIKNGSGLFDANRVTAFSTVSLLRWAWRDGSVQPEYVAQLSIGGMDGTLRKRFRGELIRGRVRAKTGTLDDVISLSGYVLREGGQGPVAFSILFNRVGGRQSDARRVADRFVENLTRWTLGLAKR
jgi:serine-type D-Ala-D-Ala carboxypeptidase/endopeptidase (penicillin-binding protein 4)